VSLEQITKTKTQYSILTLKLNTELEQYKSMFDFEKLIVYQKAKSARKATYDLLARKSKLDRTASDQLNRAIMAIILNIAEGTGKSSKPDKRNFFTIARGSVYEVVAILDILSDDGILNSDEHDQLYSTYEEISKMLLGLISSLK